MQFICGKGGVGKSAISAALASSFAKKGDSTLLVQVNTSDSHSDYFNSEPIGSSLSAISDKLFAINLNPEMALETFMGRKIVTKMAYRWLLKNAVVQSFIRFVPGLDELMMLGQIFAFAENKLSKQPKFEHIVVDCPATGHGIRFINVARVAHEGAKTGPIAQEAKKIADFVADEKKCVLHLATLAKELPMLETLTLKSSIDERKSIKLGLVYVNQMLELLTDGLEESSASNYPIIRSRLLQEQSQTKEVNRLHAALNCPTVLLPRVFDSKAEIILERMLEAIS